MSYESIPRQYQKSRLIIEIVLVAVAVLVLLALILFIFRKKAIKWAEPKLKKFIEG